VAQILWSLDVGGLERVVVDLVRGLDRERFESVVYCLEREGTWADDIRSACERVESLDKPPGRSYGLPLRIARMLKRDRVDVVHTHNFGPLLYGGLAARLARVRGVVHTLHGAEASERREHRTFQRLRLFDRMVAVSDDVKRVAIESGGVDPSRITTVYNGIDTSKYSSATGRGDEVRRQLVVARDERLVGVVARLTPEKDHATLLDAFRLVVNTHPNCRLVVVGDGELKGALVSQSQSLGIEDRVTFLGSRSDVPELVFAFDVVVLPSKVEGLGITLLEAMAAGRPTVGARAGGIPEVVVEGETGLLVDPGDAPGFAVAIARLLNDDTLAAEMGRNGRARVERRFGLAGMISSYEAIYEKIC
jgi:sugar transferase (PEP-CTERM/EpsH1 system associated)